MNLKEIMIINILLLKGICKDFLEAINWLQMNLVPSEIEDIAEKIIQSFSRSLYLNGPNVNLWMGMTHTPFEKQSSLRIFKKKVDVSDVAEAIYRVWRLENDQEWRGSDNISDEEIIAIFRYMQPCFILLNISMAEKEVIEEFRKL